MVKHMLQSRHTVLQAECVLALTLLAAKPERLLQECLEADTVISEAVADVLGTLLEDEHVPLELKSNVCVLLVELLSQQQEHDVFWKRRTQWEASLTKLEEVHGLGVGGLANAQKALRDVIARM